MSKKKSIQVSESQPVASTWLLSYADMMTLIACFFILMMALPPIMTQLALQRKTIEVSKHFNKDKYKSSETKLKILQEEIAKHPELKKKFKVSIKDDQLHIKVSGSTLLRKTNSN